MPNIVIYESRGVLSTHLSHRTKNAIPTPTPRPQPMLHYPPWWIFLTHVVHGLSLLHFLGTPLIFL